MGAKLTRVLLGQLTERPSVPGSGTPQLIFKAAVVCSGHLHHTLAVTTPFWPQTDRARSIPLARGVITSRHPPQGERHGIRRPAATRDDDQRLHGRTRGPTGAR